ncbi:MAG TPA: hypothetical protein VHM92_09285 [Allosphingosinicella sp.]|nr:hypothetical protein [Allosphingosinicella sp.]
MAHPSNSGTGLPLVLGSILVLGGLAAACSSGGGDGSKPTAGAPAYASCADNPDIGPGYDFPQPAGAVASWVKDPDQARGQARARVHGWWLWIALNQGGASPLWRGWCTSTQAFDMSGGGKVGDSAPGAGGQPLGSLRRAATEAADPINLPAPIYTVPAALQAKYSQCWNPNANGGYGAFNDGPTYQNNTDIMVAGVVYNPAAYKWIRDNNLYKSATLNGLMPPSGGIAHTQMGVNSVALKPMMWPVPANGYSALPVWDQKTKSDIGAYGGYENQKVWPTAVALTSSPPPGVPTQNVTLQLNGVLDATSKKQVPANSYANATVVGTDQFFAYRPDLTNMDPCDRAILDQSAYWAYGGSFNPGDALVVVAMHVMTKEQPDWAFQSFWWSPTPNDPVYAANRPIVPNAQGPWQHYLMASTYGFPAAGSSTEWPVAFNPYIELAAGHPVETNCMNCHKRAAWPPFYASPPNASYLASPGPGALDIFGNDDAIFKSLLTVDNLWSVSDRASPPAASAAKAKAQTAATKAGGPAAAAR